MKSYKTTIHISILSSNPNSRSRGQYISVSRQPPGKDLWQCPGKCGNIFTLELSKGGGVKEVNSQEGMNLLQQGCSVHRRVSEQGEGLSWGASGDHRASLPRDL